MKHRISLFVVLLICGTSLPSLSGLLIFPFSTIGADFTILYAILLPALFLLIARFVRNRKPLRRYWQIFFAFFVASVAILFDILVNLPSETESGLVLDMLVSTAIIVSTIIIIIRVSGNSLGSIFPRKGNLRLGLTSGLIGFFFFALTAIPAAQYLFQGQNLSLDRLIAWLPWILPIVLLNGIREELLYRGLFLKRFEPDLGLKTSNLLQAIIFSLSHSVAGIGLNNYTPFVWALVIFTFSLGLLWGYIIQRTDSIIGSALFHAGTDIPIFLGIFSNAF
ncbi:MAG: CPBP family intramembrane metalloprotease [Candidatus Bathyarchaeota archaeon]|nr:CPBP family intramembrane metalloprotease [Candidatus Bathyarchaeota archaeon]